MGIAFGAKGTTVTGPYVDSQTESIFAATRSVVFAGTRIVLASQVGMRKVAGAAVPASVYELLSLDTKTGEVKNERQVLAFGSLPVFATADAHVVVAGRELLRLSPDLKDGVSFDYRGNVENVSPDDHTLGEMTSPGYELIDTRTLKVTQLTSAPAVDTSVGRQGFVTDNVHWTGKYPKDIGFVTYVDAAGEHLLYHGKCGGRPQFLTNDLVLEPGCKRPRIINLHSELVRTLATKGGFSFAGVSQNGKRFALQTTHTARQERFTVYSVSTGEPITEVAPDRVGQNQSWTAFSPDGSLFIVGSPLKLTLYRLP
ncbi:MAG: hypothetical protein WBQ34_04965 [Candidatus Acidiferrales bacterium]